MSGIGTKETHTLQMDFDGTKSINKALEELRGLLHDSKGFVLVAMANKNEKTGIATTAGGEFSMDDIGLLSAETLMFCKKISHMAKSGPCQCPTCRAKRDMHTDTPSSVSH